jgi:dienelactone hydrolase
MLVYFGGWGYRGGLADCASLVSGDAFAGLQQEFVLVAPLLAKDTWWFLDGGGAFGWVEGAFMDQAVIDFLAWLEYLSQDPRIDEEWISLLGFSAGAYAVVELLAKNRQLRFRGAVLGGIHGHGQPDMKNIPTNRKLSEHAVREKWEQFLWRLGGLQIQPVKVLPVHNTEDNMSPWEHAQELYAALAKACPISGGVEILDVPASRKHSTHDYFDRTFTRTRLEQLLPRRCIFPPQVDVGELIISETPGRGQEPPMARHTDIELRGSWRYPIGEARNLKCASPHCNYKVNPDPEFGGYCCRSCVAKGTHGPLCKRHQAEHDTVKALPQAPSRPMKSS